MKAIYWMVAVAGIAFVQPAQAQGVGSTEIILYRFPGVRDNGGAPNMGVATSFHCTNFSGATEIIRIVIRQFSGALVVNTAFDIAHLETVTASTHQNNLYSVSAVLGTGAINQGTAAIAATSTNISCTAMTADAASFSPVGISLRGIRFNPIPGSQE